MRLLDRHLLKQLLLPAVIGLMIFVVILMSEAALKLGEALVGSRVPVAMIARYFLYSLPRAISWSLPVGLLVAVAMTTTAMARNGEATATRVGGVSPQRMWASFVWIGALATIACFGIEEYVVPSANERATQAFLDMTHLQPVMRPRDEQAFRDKDGRILYVGHMDEKTNQLERVMVLTEDAKGRLVSLTAAHWAELRGEHWLLRDGVEMRFAPDGEPVGQAERFDAREVLLWTALQDYYLDQRTPFEMSAREMRKSAETLEVGGIDSQQMKVRLQFRYSIPVACLVFVLLAAPLGTRFAHLGSFAGIVVSILIVFLYNGVRSWGLAFGLVGDLPPLVAGWAQNAIFGALGVWLMVKAR
jgi:lipopolysaccharide export system permease protein